MAAVEGSNPDQSIPRVLDRRVSRSQLLRFVKLLWGLPAERWHYPS